MTHATDGVTNWMHMFRWIVKLIRDDYGIEEARLVRGAGLEEVGLAIEQVEDVLAAIAGAFAIRFPPGTLDEVIRLEELCMLAAWAKGLYRQPEFLGAPYIAACRAANPSAA
jgi:hypothetical protein